ncbi:helix-turn-helix domain-containing protein [Spirosoma validum]|uniref:Helix-turn-helix domain-containing protein n=1 Tax=Spirosoma validum TaxID=2771355 RepID=A0A927B1S6_9BACT|nr:helix-turn-helix domain-containing protein [Spirosoma validum]MBD2753825.1 helix-turn-helix domain-containing protein [Spirosoma validum]
MDFLQTLAMLPDQLTRIEALMDANTKALNQATEQLGNTRYYEADAAKYLGVEQKTMYHYRQRGLPYEKVGRIISYLRKDLDAWRSAGKVHA